MSNCVTIWLCYTVYWIFKTLLANGNSRVKPETLTGKAPILPVLSKQIEIATQSLLHLKHDFPEVLLTFLKNKPYVHLSDISKGNEFLRCLTQKQEGPLAQVHFIQLIMATTTLKLSLEIRLWREGLICQQMHSLWLCSAYAADDSAEIWKAAVCYYNVLYLAWGLWHARNWRATSKFALSDW